MARLRALSGRASMWGAPVWRPPTARTLCLGRREGYSKGIE